MIVGRIIAGMILLLCVYIILPYIGNACVAYIVAGVITPVVAYVVLVSRSPSYLGGYSGGVCLICNPDNTNNGKHIDCQCARLGKISPNNANDIINCDDTVPAEIKKTAVAEKKSAPPSAVAISPEMSLSIGILATDKRLQREEAERLRREEEERLRRDRMSMAVGMLDADEQWRLRELKRLQHEEYLRRVPLMIGIAAAERENIRPPVVKHDDDLVGRERVSMAVGFLGARERWQRDERKRLQHEEYLRRAPVMIGIAAAESGNILPPAETSVAEPSHDDDLVGRERMSMAVGLLGARERWQRNERKRLQYEEHLRRAPVMIGIAAAESGNIRPPLETPVAEPSHDDDLVGRERVSMAVGLLGAREQWQRNERKRLRHEEYLRRAPVMIGIAAADRWRRDNENAKHAQLSAERNMQIAAEQKLSEPMSVAVAIRSLCTCNSEYWKCPTCNRWIWWKVLEGFKEKFTLHANTTGGYDKYGGEGEQPSVRDLKTFAYDQCNAILIPNLKKCFHVSDKPPKCNCMYINDHVYINTKVKDIWKTYGEFIDNSCIIVANSDNSECTTYGERTFNFIIDISQHTIAHDNTSYITDLIHGYIQYICKFRAKLYKTLLSHIMSVKQYNDAPPRLKHADTLKLCVCVARIINTISNPNPGNTYNTIPINKNWIIKKHNSDPKKNIIVQYGWDYTPKQKGCTASEFINTLYGICIQPPTGGDILDILKTRVSNLYVVDGSNYVLMKHPFRVTNKTPHGANNTKQQLVLQHDHINTILSKISTYNTLVEYECISNNTIQNNTITPPPAPPPAKGKGKQ